MQIILAMLLLCLFFGTPAAAKIGDQYDAPIVQRGTLTLVHGGKHYSGRAVIKITKKKKKARTVKRTKPYKQAEQILPHPPGCPSRSFCGCGAALEVYGKHVRELWLARNWFRFPRAEPAPGRVAVRRTHVFVIRQVLASGWVLAYDANSGGRKTRLHVRSLRGYTVVNPHGSRYARAA